MRQGVEQSFNIHTKGQEFELVQQMEKELQTKNKEYPVTNCTLNEVKEYQSQTQDGRGGGRPNDCSLQEKDKDDE